MTDEEEKIYVLSSKITEQGIILEKDIERLEQYINTLDIKVNKDFKQELWDIKRSIKQIGQNEKDIGILLEKAESNTELLKSTKETLEAKMVTKTELEDKKYKNIGVKLSVLAIIISLGSSITVGYFGYKKLETLMTNTGTTHVPSNNKK